jgi:hypothetical protein
VPWALRGEGDVMFSARSFRVQTIARVVAAAALVISAEGLSISALAATPGSVVWSKRFNGSGNSSDQASADAVSPDGSTVFVTGYVYQSFTGNDYGTVAYNASTGAVRWTKRYNGPGFSSDQAYAVAVSPDGSRVFVTGSSYSTTSLDYATVAYDASSGATLWTKRYNGPGNTSDEAYALGVSPNGAKVFVTGYSYGSGTQDYATVAYGASSGSELWVKRYNGANYEDTATTLDVSPDGTTVFVSGRSYGPSTGFDYATVAYGTGTGVQRWVKRYNDPINSDDQARSIGVSPDSSTVFVTGFSNQSTTGYDYTTIAYDTSTGAKLWSKLYNGPGTYTDQANALAVSPDGSSVVVTGQDYSSTTGWDYGTVAYNASTGARLWAKRYVGAASTDEAKDVAISPDSSTVIVTGYSYGSTTTNDYATVAYNASTGTTLWAKRYNDPDNSDDVAKALDVSATAVFVTGYSYSSSSNYDYGTIAYALK